MFTREVNVTIVGKSWGRKSRPGWAKSPPAVQTVDVGRALLMLGSLTTPNGFSAGSPERYWACIRYFSACTASPGLQIRSSFLELDPHQKSILSDDFGVAISTSWLVDKLGGLRDIVDGRQFMINMGVHYRGKRLPKVGLNKCPDFVIEDMHGILHILECKGTQSGRKYLARAMQTGLQQKHGIKLPKLLRGENLVIGILLTGEGNSQNSQIVVIDPEIEPLTLVQKADAKKVKEVLARLRLARALSLSGFPRTAFELTLPEHMNRRSAELSLLTSNERKIFLMDYEDRQRGLEVEHQAEFLSVQNVDAGDFVVQQMQFNMPALRLDSGDIARRITVRRGISSTLIEGLAKSRRNMREVASSILAEAAVRSDVARFTETSHSNRLDYQDQFFSEIIFD